MFVSFSIPNEKLVCDATGFNQLEFIDSFMNFYIYNFI